MHPDYSQELEVARKVALDAARLVLASKQRPLDVQHKTGGEPVSKADLESSALIVGQLRLAFPDDAILSEEMPDDGARLRNSRVWMIDPIDGTRDFLRGEPGYVVMVGMCYQGRPVVGVVVQPETGLLWLAGASAGAWKESPSGERVRLAVSAIDETKHIRLVSSKSHRSDYYRRFCESLGITDDLSLGSVGLKMSTIAEGSRDLYVYPGSQTKLWDSCAPEAILTAAGGTVTDSDGLPLSYLEARLHNPRGIVASNGRVHAQALAAIARLRAESTNSVGPLTPGG
jgi:3'(2'), 5'-bisphosphate nucleotidase